MRPQLVSTTIQPVAGTIDPTRMELGEPGLPRQFRWGDRTIRILNVLNTWSDTGPCRHGSGEQYTRKHWFEVMTDSGDRMKIYFERQPRGRNVKSRWRLFTIDKQESPDSS